MRPLALFDSPLDPGMLVKAAAAGIDIASIVSGLSQPVSPVRSRTLIAKAIELAGEVKGMGAALEKGDAEHLAQLRQGHEIAIAQMVQATRFTQWKHAEAQTEAPLRSRAATLERYRFYQRMLGQTPDSSVAPDMFTLDRSTLLTQDNFDDVLQGLVGQFDLAVPQLPYAPLQLAQAASPSNQSGNTGTRRLGRRPRARDRAGGAAAISSRGSTALS